MTRHHILPGSLEINGTVVTAGVHTGRSEWDIKDLRYVSVDTAGVDPKMMLSELLAHTYDNSTGCQVQCTFKMNGVAH